MSSPFGLDCLISYRGWAKREGYEKTCGKKCIDSFIVNMDVMLELGCYDQRSKMQSGRMLEALKFKN